MNDHDRDDHREHRLPLAGARQEQALTTRQLEERRLIHRHESHGSE